MSIQLYAGGCRYRQFVCNSGITSNQRTTWNAENAKQAFLAIQRRRGSINEPKSPALADAHHERVCLFPRRNRRLILGLCIIHWGLAADIEPQVTRCCQLVSRSAPSVRQPRLPCAYGNHHKSTGSGERKLDTYGWGSLEQKRFIQGECLYRIRRSRIRSSALGRRFVSWRYLYLSLQFICI
jgi:hypothetical protein